MCVTAETFDIWFIIYYLTWSTFYDWDVGMVFGQNTTHAHLTRRGSVCVIYLFVLSSCCYLRLLGFPIKVDPHRFPGKINSDLPISYVIRRWYQKLLQILCNKKEWKDLLHLSRFYCFRKSFLVPICKNLFCTEATSVRIYCHYYWSIFALLNIKQAPALAFVVAYYRWVLVTSNKSWKY